jgi:hypothetical protein
MWPPGVDRDKRNARKTNRLRGLSRSERPHKAGGWSRHIRKIAKSSGLRKRRSIRALTVSVRQWTRSRDDAEVSGGSRLAEYSFAILREPYSHTRQWSHRTSFSAVAQHIRLTVMYRLSHFELRIKIRGVERRLCSAPISVIRYSLRSLRYGNCAPEASPGICASSPRCTAVRLTKSSDLVAK